ncbi:hypothetical protein ESCAB7627_0923 [Escherichia albertii TW07627]|uniref:Uncharacterized protein n=1 Tax=Escherichia albertii (strain TW07627) TaxID=502347 RepID=A0ABC9NV92_ESCAT|nr:hypothetical protein ESCAB7627_0923 [Escherichia albertii TW07627]
MIASWFYRKLQKKKTISGEDISPTNESGWMYYFAADVFAGC